MTQIKSILPPNATQLQKDLEAATTQRLLSLDENRLRYLNNPELCQPEFLPWLAWSMSVDVWNNDWSIDTKRTVVRESMQVHQTKGTLGSLRRALEAFMASRIRITEWYEYNGDPYTFRVYATFQDVSVSLDDFETIYRTIVQTKNLRSQLEYFLPEIEHQEPVPKYGVAFGHLETTTIYPENNNV